MTPDKIDVMQAFDSIPDLWSPRVAARVNGHEVRFARVKGEFCWHRHEDEDELFWVVRGRLELQFRDRVETLEPGQMMLVPHGVEHRPVAHEETWIVLFEPADTRNTGDVTGARTIERPADLRAGVRGDDQTDGPAGHPTATRRHDSQ